MRVTWVMVVGMTAMAATGCPLYPRCNPNERVSNECPDTHVCIDGRCVASSPVAPEDGMVSTSFSGGKTNASSFRQSSSAPSFPESSSLGSSSASPDPSSQSGGEPSSGSVPSSAGRVAMLVHGAKDTGNVRVQDWEGSGFGTERVLGTITGTVQWVWTVLAPGGSRTTVVINDSGTVYSQHGTAPNVTGWVNRGDQGDDNKRRADAAYSIQAAHPILFRGSNSQGSVTAIDLEDNTSTAFTLPNGRRTDWLQVTPLASSDVLLVGIIDSGSFVVLTGWSPEGFSTVRTAGNVGDRNHEGLQLVAVPGLEAHALWGDEEGSIHTVRFAETQGEWNASPETWCTQDTVEIHRVRAAAALLNGVPVLAVAASLHNGDCLLAVGTTSGCTNTSVVTHGDRACTNVDVVIQPERSLVSFIHPSTDTGTRLMLTTWNLVVAVGGIGIIGAQPTAVGPETQDAITHLQLAPHPTHASVMALYADAGGHLFATHLEELDQQSWTLTGNLSGDDGRSFHLAW